MFVVLITDKQDDSGNTAMHYAARYRDNAKFIAILLKYKPNCNIKNKQGRTPLHKFIIIFKIALF